MSELIFPRPEHNTVPYGNTYVHNGYLVVAPSSPGFEKVYQGIDDDVWPIESDDNWSKFARKMGIPGHYEGVLAATYWEETFAYWQRCLEFGFQARLLLLDTRYLHPQVTGIQKNKWRRLGYDVADPLGQHSAIRHQLIGGTAPQLAGWRTQLNTAGLFGELFSAEAFIEEWYTIENRQGLVPSPPFDFVPILVATYRGT